MPAVARVGEMSADGLEVKFSIGAYRPPPFRPADIAGETVLPTVPFDYFIDPDWKASDKFSVSRELADGYARAWAREQDAVVREMLGRWVSEFEPCLIVRNTHVVGLSMVGDPEGRVIVRPIAPAYAKEFEPA